MSNSSGCAFFGAGAYVTDVNPHPLLQRLLAHLNSCTFFFPGDQPLLTLPKRGPLPNVVRQNSPHKSVLTADGVGVTGEGNADSRTPRTPGHGWRPQSHSGRGAPAPPSHVEERVTMRVGGDDERVMMRADDESLQK